MKSNNDVVIDVKNLSKSYKLYNRSQDRLKEALHPLRKKFHKTFFALNDINFSIKKGESLGIVGANGSGKSTLLKILTGVITPTSGTVQTIGKISALLELGAGFNPNLTGLENIYFSGLILGLTKEEMDKKLDSILSFAEIGDFIYSPIKTYSSGMYVRLAFSVAINVEPDILIIDEALSVGDIKFTQKCLRKLFDFQERNKTILFVSHDSKAIINMCNRAIWLKDGLIAEEGKPETVIKRYTSFMTFAEEVKSTQNQEVNLNSTNSPYKLQSISKCESLGTEAAKIEGVLLCDKISFKPLTVFTGGEEVLFVAKIKTFEKIHSPGLGIRIQDYLGNHVFTINTYIYDFKIQTLEKGSEVLIKYAFTFPHIHNGNYTLTVALSEGTQHNHIQLHWVHDAISFQVLNPSLIYQVGCTLVLPQATVGFECNVL